MSCLDKLNALLLSTVSVEQFKAIALLPDTPANAQHDPRSKKLTRLKLISLCQPDFQQQVIKSFPSSQLVQQNFESHQIINLIGAEEYVSQPSNKKISKKGVSSIADSLQTTKDFDDEEEEENDWEHKVMKGFEEIEKNTYVVHTNTTRIRQVIADRTDGRTFICYEEACVANQDHRASKKSKDQGQDATLAFDRGDELQRIDVTGQYLYN